MRVEALKSFRAGGSDLKRGDIVDASGWPNLLAMISNRFVRPAEEAEEDERFASAKDDARQLSPSSIKTETVKRGRGRKRKGA
jgi:hypothetical protein